MRKGSDRISSQVINKKKSESGSRNRSFRITNGRTSISCWLRVQLSSDNEFVIRNFLGRGHPDVFCIFMLLVLGKVILTDAQVICISVHFCHMLLYAMEFLFDFRIAYRTIR